MLQSQFRENWLSLRSSKLLFHRKMNSWTMPKWLSWILLFKLAQVYETRSIADALKSGQRNPIKRAFNYYFSPFLQSSNSIKHYEEWSLKGIKLNLLARCHWPIRKEIILKRLLLWSAVCNYARMSFRIFLSHLYTSDRLENLYTWKWKKKKTDR